MAEKDTNARRKTRQIRVSLRCRAGIARMAKKCGVSMGALIERLYLDEVARGRRIAEPEIQAVNAPVGLPCGAKAPKVLAGLAKAAWILKREHHD